MITESGLNTTNLSTRDVGSIFGSLKLEAKPVKRIVVQKDSEGNVLGMIIVTVDDGKPSRNGRTSEQDQQPIRGHQIVGWKRDYGDTSNEPGSGRKDD